VSTFIFIFIIFLELWIFPFEKPAEATIRLRSKTSPFQIVATINLSHNSIKQSTMLMITPRPWSCVSNQPSARIFRAEKVQTLVHVVTANGESARIAVNVGKDTIETFMAKIEKNMGILTHNQSLSILGDALIDTDELRRRCADNEVEICLVHNGLTRREATKAGLVFKDLVHRSGVRMKEGVYDGQWRNSSWSYGKPQGEGNMVYASGSVYEGQWENGFPQGEGIYTTANGDKYDGDWQDDKQHGQGIYTYANGGNYDGDWQDGKKHGRGIYTYASGDKYDGEWQNNKWHGRGIYTRADGLHFHDGEWQNNKQHGRGIDTGADGGTYDGDWQDGKRHGRGIDTGADGEKYDGEWQNNKYVGRGIYTRADGEIRVDVLLIG
jgi:hypothetical protein